MNAEKLKKLGLYDYLHNTNPAEKVCFFSAEHINNYEHLMSVYELTPGEAWQMEASIYIAAFPEIYAKLKENGINKNKCPLLSIPIEEHNFTPINVLLNAGRSISSEHEVVLGEIIEFLSMEPIILAVFQEACNFRMLQKRKGSDWLE